jgi:phosphate/sulfate permease
MADIAAVSTDAYHGRGANGSCLQWCSVRSIALAWVITLPAAMLLAGKPLLPASFVYWMRCSRAA